ncbi:ribonuclease H-like domain-containing protein, partial [Hygrophoropsis aurantiaca]
GQITMDNASNNNTLMAQIENELQQRDIPFDRDGNPKSLRVYADALALDPIGECREIVAACRSSGQRRRRLKAVIKEGNEKGYWEGKLPNNETTLPVLQLLRDCVVRWSSTYGMIERVLLLYPAIRSFLQDLQHTDISHLDMSAQELDVLRDIHQVLEVPHCAQELLSAERTPTLSMALPSYEDLICQWITLQSTLPELSHYIGVGLDKLKDYTNEARKTRVYALAMIINPGIKLDWIASHWTEDETSKARSWILDAVRHQVPFLICVCADGLNR